jgi:putative membrane protein
MSSVGTAPPDTGTRLAVERTRLAAERTMMAWIRTGTSLISFGFSIHKFFQLRIEQEAAAKVWIGPRGFALMMIATGLLALLLSAVQHHQSIQAMRANYGPQQRSAAAMIAVLMSAIGVMAFAAVLFRV